MAASALRAGSRRPIRAYVGTYSSPDGPEGSKGRGGGIYRFDMDPSTGALTQRDLFEDATNPSWIAFNTAHTHLYAANETSVGGVSAFSVDSSTSRLTLLNRTSSGGAGPAHLSLHPSGKFLFTANYAGGTIASIPIEANGRLGDPVDIKHDQGEVGPMHAASAPLGSFAISGHDKPHAHMIQSDPSGKFVVAADLGLDQIRIYRFDVQTGLLTPNDPPVFKLPAGDGPRHFAFHPNRKWFYSLQEESSTLLTCDYDASRGALTAKQTISTLPKGFAGTNFTSELLISPDARFVYAANRLHDSIAWFAIADDGTLTPRGETWTRGDYPRSFNIDPTGNFLYSCNQRADAIACFSRDKRTGALIFIGQYTPVGTPAIIVFA